MRRLFVLSLLALACAASSIASAATPAVASADALEVFTLENTLIHWRAQGLRDARGRVVVPADTVELSPLPGGGWLSRAGLGGELLDARGQRVAGPFVYVEQVDPALDAVLIGTEGSPLLGGKGGLVRSDGKVVAEPVHLRLDYLAGTGMFAFQRARRTGVMDAQGRVVLEPIYDSVTALPPLLLASKQEQVAVFDRNGKDLTGFQRGLVYQEIKGTPLIRECREPVSENDDALPRCRVLDAALRPAIAGEFSEIEFLPGVRRWVAVPWRKSVPEDLETSSESSNRTLLLLDEKGQRKAELQAQSITESEGRLLITVAGPEGSYERRTGLADADGRWLFKPDYDQIEPMAIAFGERRDMSEPVSRRFRVLHWGEGGGYGTGVIDADGRLLMPLSDVQILEHYPSLDIYVAKQGDKVGVIDAKGQWRIPARHQQTAPNSTLPAPYLLFADYSYASEDDDENRYTLYDLRSGQPVFKAQYDYLSLEDSWWPLGLRAPWPEYVIVSASKDGRRGVIDLDERIVVPFQYHNIDSPDRRGQVNVYRDEDDMRGQPRDGLPAAKVASLREQVSREIRAQQAPLASAHAPYAGRYVPVIYTDAAQVSAAAAKGALSRPVAPMILVDSETAILDLDMITDRKRPPLEYLEYYCAREDGFDILMPGAGTSEDACADPEAPRLVLRPAANDEWECGTCAGFGLPPRWRRTDPAPNPALP